MTIDPKRVKEIFLEAAELSEDAARAAYLDKACGGDAGLRARVEALLLNHDPEDSFLGIPATVVPDPDLGATQSLTGNSDPGGEAAPSATGENGPSDDESLSFLSPPTRPDALGRLGHYEVLQVLGRGGFGIVFRAFDEMLQRVVALKVMAPQLAATSPARKRFLREARSSAQVRHENVVQVYEVAEQPLPYLAMEFIPGETLQQKLNRVGPLDVLETLRIGRQIAEGLAAAHAMDLIHRDIKPGNVLLEGGQHKVKITDFGLARTADDASISQSGIIAGTPMYMAPEQAQGQTLDQRADLFSLGSVLYQMVAGRPPFRANSAVAVLKRVAEDTPRAIREIIPEAPQWLCDIIAKLHAKNPDDRYQSAREVADVLADCEAQLKANAKLKDYSRIPRSKAPRSGRRRWVAAAVAVLLPVIALVVTEFAGVTHLFRGQEARNDETEGWVQLFNGKDLSGWKKHPIKPGFWRVDENGHLVGAGPVDKYAFLGTERDDFENFHLRLEAMVDSPESDSGVFFRVPFHFESGGFSEINISPARSGAQTGSLLVAKERWEKYGDGTWYPAATGLTKPKEWFILEIIAHGDHVVTKVNGKLALDTEVQTPNRRGHIFLQQQGGWTIVRFRKIEIKELPPAGVRTASGTEDKLSFDAKQAQEATAKRFGIPVETTNSNGMKFRLIPPGKFMMGSSKEEIDYWLRRGGNDWFNEKLLSEGPQHEVELTRPFYLGQTEVTVGQFRRFVQATGYQMQSGAAHFGKWDAKKNWLNPGFSQTDDHPVVCVSWNDAVEFCNWLSKKEGKTYRLPTEAEWEYGCRAGSKGRWSFGDHEFELLDYARFLSNSQEHTWPVAGLKANAWGLHDMHGNVWELCRDIYDVNYYKTSPPKDPRGPGAGGERVQRGGAWCFRPGQCRSAFRVRLAPGHRFDDNGFRVVLAVSAAAGGGTESGAMAAKRAQEASAKQLGIPVETVNSNGMKFRLIPAGKFTMGSSKEEIDFWLKKNVSHFAEHLPWEAPQHEVEITQPFYMGQTEVTVGQFRQFVKATGYKTQAEREGGAKRGFPNGEYFKEVANTDWLNPGFAQTDDHPVVCVSWNDAVEFCRWLSKQEASGVASALRGTYRLPTEAEWEYSCRAGSKGRWSFGDNEGELWDYARDGGNAQNHSWPVAGLKANPWGLYDMHGNVTQWCQDVFDRNYYKTSPPKDPPGPAAGDARAIRGGSWLWHEAHTTRSAIRYYTYAARRANFAGFRVVRVVSSPKTKTPPLAVGPFTDADVQRIAALPAEQQIEEVRKELKRRNPGFDGKIEHKIAGGVVTEFQILTDKVTDIAPIRVFDALRVLVCSGTSTNDRSNGLLADLTPLEGMNLASLTHLGLWNTKVSDAGLAYFKDCKGLRHLGLGYTKVSDAGLANFKDCKNLIQLWVHNTPVGDAGLAHFHDCKDLADLNLAGTKVSDVGLAPFKDCKNLKYLWLDRTQVGDAGLALFKGISLRALSIDSTRITDLTPLQGMTLEEIRLTPKNITRGLDIIRGMKSLKTIGIAWQQTWPAAEFWQRYDKGEFK